MRWSQLKTRVEETFAKRVKGRVEIFATRYHHAHDDAGECWVTIDGARVACMAEISYWKHRVAIQNRLQREQDLEKPDLRNPQQRALAWGISDVAAQITHEDQVYSDDYFKKVLFDYLNLSIDEIMSSDNPIVRAFGMLDHRFGMRRLKAFDAREETAFVRRLYDFRCLVEGVGSGANGVSGTRSPGQGGTGRWVKGRC